MEREYNPEKLETAYRRLGHDKARADAIRYAIEQADLNNDIPYMVFFRKEFCNEAIWYADEIDIYTVFPELLSLIDRYPDAEPVPSQYNDIMQDILDIYGALVVDSSDFYQIPLEECVKFYNDFKERWINAGHNASLPYRYMAAFYRTAGDAANTTKFFNKFKDCPPGRNDCKACITNSKINYYLFNNEKEKADKLAAKIEDGTVRCEGAANNSFALLRLKQNYLKYYIIHGDYGNAAECADILEHKHSYEKEFKQWAFIMCAYIYSNPGRGMRIYRSHWAEWEEERNPNDKYGAFMCAACFFKGIKKQKEKDTVKINAGSSFPLYNGSNVYELDSLIEYYYKGAEEIARKFDQRNGTSKFMDGLNMSFENINI